MTRLSPHFVRAEFACKCGCGFDTADAATLEILDAVRTHFGQPVIINSGCRCPAHNAAVGGAANSQHVFGRAADIRVRYVGSDLVADWVAANFPTASIGRYATFTHIDTRTGGPARWRR